MSPILSSVKTFFKKSEALAACEENPALLPFYLLTSEGKDSLLISFLDKCDCTYTEPKHGLTLLALATILGRREVEDFLIKEKKADPMARDYAGLTPIHYAFALDDTKSLELLCSKISETTKDFFELFSEWKPILKPEFPKDDEIVFNFKNSEGKISQGTAKEFFELTNAQFYDGTTMDKQSLSAQWAEQLEKAVKFKESALTLTLNNYLCQHFALLKNDPLSFYVEKQGAAGNGVFTKQKLIAGKPFALYGGEHVATDSDTSSHYVFENVDALKIRNLGAMINDGFPNCAIWSLQLPDGRVYEVFVALRDIEPGEALYLHYGFEHPIKFYPRKELNPEEWIHFFKTHTISSLLGKISKRIAAANNELESAEPEKALLSFFAYARYQGYLCYLFHTPNVLISAFFLGLIKLEDIEELFKNPFLEFAVNAQQYKGLLEHIKTIYGHLKTIQDNLSEQNSKAVKEFFIELCNTSSFWTIKGVMQYFNEQTSPPDLKALTHFAKTLEQIHEVLIWDLSKTKMDFVAALKKMAALPSSDQTFIQKILTDEAAKNPAIKDRLRSMRSK